MITSGFNILQPWRTRAGLLLSTLLLLGSPSYLQAAVSPLPRVLSPESIKKIPAGQAAAAGPQQARILRMALSADETSAPMDVEVALRMRNFAELQARVARGEIISREEMAAKYFPLAADYEAMAAWLTAQGLTVTRDDTMRLSLFARGTISQLKQAFQVDFARVTTEDGEFTSAITAPSLPAALEPALVGVNGLQPHLRPHKMTAALVVQKASLTSPNAPPYLPSEILKGYSANTTGLTGAGQTIAIVIDTYPLDSDLTTFWSRCGINRSPNSSVQHFQVPGTPAPSNPATLDSSGIPLGTEAVIDAELTSSLAPGANIRVYTTGELTFTNLSRGYQQVYDDLASQPTLHVLNLSYGIGENLTTFSQRQSDAQHFAALAGGGVTVFASSGDGGSNPDPNSGAYNASATLQPAHPASDPNVTGVGATTLMLDASSGAETSETAWSLNQYSKGLAASGGGISLYFSRPDWQTGTGVPGGTMRLVPDVAVVGDPSTGAYIVNVGLGSNDPGGHTWGGTSISTPIWSGFGALLNQARASSGLPPLGLLGPKIYPLIGTTSLRDMTSGNNGYYTATAGYDMVTGVGAPNIPALVQAIASVSSAPVILTQPVSQTVPPGQNATFSVTASGSPLPAYQWQLQTPGGATWSNLSNNTTYGGATTATLTMNSVTDTMSGNLFQCVISNTNGTATTAPPAALIVTYPLSLSTLAGQAGSSGSTDGTGSAARFDDPSDVAADSAGNVYVADTNNHTIRKITSAGVVTTLAGLAGTSGSTDGTGSAARFNLPAGLTVDGSGNIYVADTYNHTIRKITSTGAVSTVAGQAGSSGSADGTGSNARFNYPSGVAVDSSGNLYVADTNNFTIRKITPAGAVSTVAGLAGISGISDGDGSAARFSSPEGVTVDGSGNLYVADTDNHTIRKITPAGAVTTLAGLAGTSGGGDGSGSVAQFQYPSDLAVDSAGNLYVADTDNHTIRKITPAGLVGTVAGLAGSSGSTDGVGSVARMFYPTGAALDGAGNVYVADTNNHTVRKGIVVALPQITAQPQSQTVTAGANVTFTVQATGLPAPTYQWYNTGVMIGGATSATLTLSNVQVTNSGSYYVVVTNVAGSVTSNAATLTVNAASTQAVSTGSSSGGGGGGGAPSLWFYGALSLLVALRRVFRRK
jgi:hypothetical protein